MSLHLFVKIMSHLVAELLAARLHVCWACMCVESVDFREIGRKMWSESECVTFMPQLIIHLIHQVGPLNAFDLYFCITSLFLLLSPLFYPSLPLHHPLPFSNVSHISDPLVFVLLNRSLLPSTILYSPFDIFFSLHVCSILSWPLYVTHICNPSLPLFVFLSHRPLCG